MFTPSYKMIFVSQYLILRKRGETEAAISAPKQVLNTLAMWFCKDLEAIFFVVNTSVVVQKKTEGCVENEFVATGALSDRCFLARIVV